jgi:signal transduction histidine kinase
MHLEIEKGNMIEIKDIARDILQNTEKITHHGKRADSIVKSMLQHSRAGTGHIEPTDINKLAVEYLKLSQHVIMGKEKDFQPRTQTSFDPAIEKINIIPQEIGRLLLNLLNNAFWAVSEKYKLVGKVLFLWFLSQLKNLLTGSN